MLRTVDEIVKFNWWLFWFDEFDESKSHAAIILKKMKKMNFEAKKLTTTKYWMLND